MYIWERDQCIFIFMLYAKKGFFCIPFYSKKKDGKSWANRKQLEKYAINKVSKERLMI